jgi:hypothetical protein
MEQRYNGPRKKSDALTNKEKGRSNKGKKQNTDWTRKACRIVIQGQTGT